MPLYEYQCESCEHRFEVIQRFSDPPVDVCPLCGGPVQKLPSSPAIQFKGTGWYITDYARKPSATAPAGSSDGGGKEGGEKSEKTADQDTKPKDAGASKTASPAASDSSRPSPGTSKDH